MASCPTPSYLSTNDQQGEYSALSLQCPHPSTVTHTSIHTGFQQTPWYIDTFPGI
ncbi:hypothetical protein ES288_A08G130600v1 [Gossypium darwinii]|uniref:Uncharacterized protein n=1 Tax=Gossypium darwinii TaxID=34276 RepID=A0A5D2FK36_GOSDA|nr:hypothetical protein ES288_A08G130600v1 [Gossypium darwinii]